MTFNRTLRSLCAAATLALCAPTARADDAAEMQEGFGQISADVAFATAKCENLEANAELFAELEKTAGVVAADADTHTKAYKRGHQQSTKDAEDILADGGAEGFCEVALKAYGPEGIRVENLLRAK